MAGRSQPSVWKGGYWLKAFLRYLILHTYYGGIPGAHLSHTQVAMLPASVVSGLLVSNYIAKLF